MTTLAIFLLVVAVLLAFRRFWVLKARPESIQGSDLHMLKYCVKEQTRAWCGVQFTFYDDADFAEVERKIRANIADHFEAAGSTYRLGLDIANRRYFTKADLRPDDIIDLVHSDEAFFATTDDERFRELVFRVYPEKRLVGLIFDHTCWDGLRLVNEIIVPMIQSRPFASRWLLVDRYIPVLAELLQIYTICITVYRWLVHRPMKTYEKEADQKVVTHRFDLAIVKASKKRNNVKFTSALLGIWMHRLFQCVRPGCDTIRVGIIIGMQNPRFRNNYSIVSVDVHREEDPDRMVRDIERQMGLRQIEVLPLYHLISSIEAQTLFKKRAIDYLFSPGFFHSHKGVSKMICDMRFITIPIGMPLYSFACSIDDVITVSTTLNSPEVSLDCFAREASARFDFEDERWLNGRHWNPGSACEGRVGR